MIQHHAYNIRSDIRMLGLMAELRNGMVDISIDENMILEAIRFKTGRRIQKHQEALMDMGFIADKEFVKKALELNPKDYD